MFTRILKKGVQGEDVKALQGLLSFSPKYSVQITGLFDETTEKAIKQFQTDNKLTSDGIVGKITTNALIKVNKPAESSTQTNNNSDLINAILETANSFVGQKEIKGNMGFKENFFMKLMESIGWRKSWAWCSMFCKLVYTESYKKMGLDPKRMTKYISPSVQQTRQNFIKAGYPLETDWRKVKPGAYISWVSAGDRSKGHTGILVEFTDNGKKMKTIEGNTNSEGSREGDSVAIKNRNAEIGKGSSLILQGWFNAI